MELLRRDRIAVGDAATHLVAGVVVDETAGALSRIAAPRAGMQLVARFGAAIPGGVDVHLLGAQPRLRRKRVEGGHRAILLRLRPGTQRAVAGIAPAALAGRVVAIDALWGDATATRLRERLAAAGDARAAAALLEAAVVERAAPAPGDASAAHRLAVAIDALREAPVAEAARAAGVSERQLRRVFRDTLGLAPKAVARLQRFAHALRAAQAATAPSWAAIAADAGYCDQAHLIAEFHAIAGAAPRALLAELRVAVPIG